MGSASQTKLLTELLNLESVQVTKYIIIPGIGLILHLESLTREAFCDRCGQKSQKIHQNHRYLVKDLPISGQPVYLEVNRRQFKGENCKKPFSEERVWSKVVGSTGDRHPKITPPIISSNNSQSQHWINIVWMPGRTWDF